MSAEVMITDGLTPDVRAAEPAKASVVQPGPLAAPAVAPEDGLLALVDNLLRGHTTLLQRIEDGTDLGGLARGLVGVIAVSAALFGAAMGGYRGGIQVFFAAVKLPMALLLTAALCTPAFAALNAAARGRLDPRRDGAIMLTSLAAASLLISGTAPLILLAGFWAFDYHATTLLVVACCAVGGLFGLLFFLRAVTRGGGPARWWLALGIGLVFAGVGSQMSWTLRPFLVRPRTMEAPFIRAIEGSFLEAVDMSFDSARGRYTPDEASAVEGTEAWEAPTSQVRGESPGEPREAVVPQPAVDAVPRDDRMSLPEPDR